jgi:hypothetical protein
MLEENKKNMGLPRSVAHKQFDHGSSNLIDQVPHMEGVLLVQHCKFGSDGMIQ